ncbi:MAG: nuclear transport factor 2 family protein [Candidatus Bathyarchaeia archaeon]
MQKEDYLVYVDHFNNKRYDKLMAYLCPDVIIEYSSAFVPVGEKPRTLKGRDEFVNFYRTLHTFVDEYLELMDFLSNEKLVFAELYTEFYCFKEPPKELGLYWREGEIRIMINWVLYNIAADGRFERIRIAHFRTLEPSVAKRFVSNK